MPKPLQREKKSGIKKMSQVSLGIVNFFAMKFHRVLVNMCHVKDFILSLILIIFITCNLFIQAHNAILKKIHEIPDGQILSKDAKRNGGKTKVKKNQSVSILKDTRYVKAQ